ncbi:MAG: DUF3098 domain-containing protein [Balneolaceae bacterium]|nr:MAG: DUF3098 domain-containing protein [Balneolaceae bacterium]
MPDKKKQRKKKENKPIIFTAYNYKLMGLGVIFVLTGFTIMRLENEVYGFISLYIAPVIILAGYIVVIFAILKKDHKTGNSTVKPSN